MYGADKAVTNFPVQEYKLRLALAGIPLPEPDADPHTAAFMAALVSAVQADPHHPDPGGLQGGAAGGADDSGGGGGGGGNGSGAEGAGVPGAAAGEAVATEMQVPPAYLAQMMAATTDVGMGAEGPLE